jgi:hypothetical protein
MPRYIKHLLLYLCVILFLNDSYGIYALNELLFLCLFLFCCTYVVYYYCHIYELELRILQHLVSISKVFEFYSQ